MRVFYVLLLCLIIGLILPSVISYYLGEYQADLGNCDTPTLLKLVDSFKLSICLMSIQKENGPAFHLNWPAQDLLEHLSLLDFVGRDSAISFIFLYVDDDYSFVFS